MHPSTSRATRHFLASAALAVAAATFMACSSSSPPSSAVGAGPDARAADDAGDTAPSADDAGDAGDAPSADDAGDAPSADGAGDAVPDAFALDADGGDSATAQDGSVASCSGAMPSLANGVYPILRANCSGELCHGGTALGAFGGAANAHDQFVNVPSTRDTCDAGVLVYPGSLERSYLMHKLTGVGMCPGTSQMPRGGTPLPAANIQTIADWICTGAPNN